LIPEFSDKGESRQGLHLPHLLFSDSLMKVYTTSFLEGGLNIYAPAMKIWGIMAGIA
jgi:hypothetical protein